MAQTGYTPISIYYSSTASNTPTAGNLVAGELAINTADGKLFYKDSAGVVQVIGTKGGVGSSTTTQVLYNSSGLVVGSANLTFNGTTLTTANDASISGLTVGKGGGADGSSTAVGYQALVNGTNPTYSTVFGYQAGAGITTGTTNTAIGRGSLSSGTTTGSSNTGIGNYSLNKLSTGNGNFAGGDSALSANTTGSYNVGVGTQSLAANTTASNNTAVGYQAGYSNTTGAFTTALGNQAGYSLTTGGGGGGYSVFVGYRAGYSITTNSYSCMVGTGAGYFSTGGGNTFVGSSSTSGFGAGYNMTTGGNNTILGGFDGNQGGLDIRTASNYIVLSDGAGNPRQVIDSSGNVIVNGTTSQGKLTVYGNNAIWGNSPTANQGALAVQNSAVNTGTSASLVAFQVGTSGIGTGVGSISYNGTLTVYSTTSDQRVKTDNGLSIDTSVIDNTLIHEFTWKNGVKDRGVFAQEAHKVKPSAIQVGTDDVNQDGELLKPWGVDYSVYVPDLIVYCQQLNKTVQELKAEVDSLKQQLGK